MCVENLVFFKDNLEDNSEMNAGLLLDNGNIICLCCGGIIEKGDYTIIKKCRLSYIDVANEVLLENYASKLTEN